MFPVLSRGKIFMRRTAIYVPHIINTPNGDTVLDFKQNLLGHVAFTVTGPAGTKVTLEMGESLDENGNT